MTGGGAPPRGGRGQEESLEGEAWRILTRLSRTFGSLTHPRMSEMDPRNVSGTFTVCKIP